MDGRNALSRPSPHGTQRVDQVALGGSRERPKAKILFHQEGWEDRAASSARRMDERSSRVNQLWRDLSCLTSNKKYENGAGTWLLRPVSTVKSWQNSRGICGKILSDRCVPGQTPRKHGKPRCSALARQVSCGASSNSAERSASRKRCADTSGSSCFVPQRVCWPRSY